MSSFQVIYEKYKEKEKFTYIRAKIRQQKTMCKKEQKSDLTKTSQ